MEILKMSRVKILFVDDEPNVLNGLRRMLHSIRFLVLGVHVFDKLSKINIGKFSLKKQVAHSLEVANLVTSLCKIENLSKEIQEVVFFAGLFHDCGCIRW